jgi:hypothetical protein
MPDDLAHRSGSHRSQPGAAGSASLTAAYHHQSYDRQTGDVRWLIVVTLTQSFCSNKEQMQFDMSQAGNHTLCQEQAT